MAANATGKSLTPSNAAKDDFLTVNLGAPGQAVALNVLANDPGSARVYSLFQHPETLGKKQAFPVVTSVTLASGAVVKMQPDGTLSYTPPANAGAEWSETFFYTARMANGTLSLAEVHLNVRGAAPVNHAPVLAAVAPVTVYDDAGAAQPYTVQGQLTATDVDPGASLRYGLVAGSSPDTAYGQLELAANGSYVFRVNAASLDALAAGDTATVSFRVQATDEHGAASEVREIEIRLVGADEPRGQAVDDVLSAAATGLDSHHLQANLNVLSNDSAGARVVAVGTSLQGASLSINPDGTIAYDAQNQYYNLFGWPQGHIWTDRFSYTVQLADGTLSTAETTVEVLCLNETPFVNAAPTVEIHDDAAAAAPLTVHGQLTATDYDQGALVRFALASGLVAESNEMGSFSVSSDGVFTFVLDPAALDAMGDGESKTLAFQVVATDEYGATSAAAPVWFHFLGSLEAVQAIGIPPAGGA